MATYTKPAKVPRWGDDLTNVLEPPEAKKDAGWLFQEIPPSNFENWKEQLNGSWWQWINERMADVAGDPDAFALVDPSGINADPIVEFDGKVALQSNLIFRDGATNSTLRVTKDTQILQWLNAANQSFSADQNKLVVGRSDVDGIRMFGVGALKGITFDSNFNQLRYDINTDTFHFFCNSASASFNIADDRIQAFQPMVIGSGSPKDAGDLNIQNGVTVGADAINPGPGQGVFGNQINVGGTPAIPNAIFSLFDSLKVGDSADNPSSNEFLATNLLIGDADFVGVVQAGGDEAVLGFNGLSTGILFDRLADDWHISIGGTDELTISALGLTGRAFVPTNTGGRLTNRFEVGQRNQICLAVKVDAIGVVSGRPWNLDTVNNINTGDWEVFADEQCTDDVMPVVSVDELSSLYHCNAVYSNVQDRFFIKTFLRSNGNDVDAGFNLIAIGG